MKAALFRKDGIGAVVGRLKAPNIVQYENEGSLLQFNLTGKVVDTEYNDVLIFGQKISDDVLNVERMESLPKAGEKYLGFKLDGEQGTAFCLAIHAEHLKEVKKCRSENGNEYHRFSFNMGKNSTLYMSVFGHYQKETSNNCYVFIMKEPPKVESKEFGSNYAVKKIVTQFASGYQIMS